MEEIVSQQGTGWNLGLVRVSYINMQMYQKTRQAAVKVLQVNDLGSSTRPTATLYPHQWLWDSCFIAIGLRHIDIERAKTEVRSLLRGQWTNGMIPYILFNASKSYHAGPELWQSEISPYCPAGISTTGGTQPPMIAEAVVKIGELLPRAERLSWYTEVYPQIAEYHQWLYRDRTVDDSGLVVVFHPWETGLDNNPALIETVHTGAFSARLKLLDRSKPLLGFYERRRRDTSVVPAKQRMTTIELMAFYDLVKDMKKYKYNDALLVKNSRFMVQDVGFNSILVRATNLLAQIAAEIDASLPPLVETAYKRGVSVLDSLWDEKDSYYYSRDCRQNSLIKQKTITSLLPLYAGKLQEKQAESILKALADETQFGTEYAVASSPRSSSYFQPDRYWQGPVWINTNWLLIKGLTVNQQIKKAMSLQASTMALVSEHGMNEYFSPLDGTPAGAPNFSWTAALTIDLLEDVLVKERKQP